MKKVLPYIVFLLLFAALGFIREFFFVNLNLVMYLLYYPQESPVPVPDIMKGFMKMDYDTLYYSKYLYTLICTLLYFALSYAAVKKLLKEKIFLKLLLVSYSAFFVVAALSMVYGYFFKQRLADDEYTLSRWLMGVLQSPIICLILVASEPLYKSSINHDNKRQNNI